MRLYHYATQPLKVLKTREAQGLVTDEIRKQALESMELHQTPGPYYAHISFFVDPLDLLSVAKIFEGRDHPVWQVGKVVYEHIVDVDDLGNFDYMWTETPLDKLFMKERWKEGMSDEAVVKYFHDLAEAKRREGLIGRGKRTFLRSAEPFLNKTMDAYRDAASLNQGRNWQQYAANVPHVMIYPPKGVVKPIDTPRKELIGVKPYVKRNNSSAW